MGAFLGYGDVGVWAGNAERDTFLDWFAEHRCASGDARWRFCKSDANRWPGCCIDLSVIIPREDVFKVTPEERAAATAQFGPDFAALLDIIGAITRGAWTHSVSSREALQLRPQAIERDARREKEQEAIVNGPRRSSSFGTDEHVRSVGRSDEPESER